MVGTPPRRAVIAHRGASAYEPEHTFAAYDLAIAMGADVLELDIRLTSDRRAVVVHDATLLRTCGVPAAVAEMRMRDLELISPAVRPLSLEDVLRRYGSEVGYLIDLKDPRPPVEREVADVLGRFGCNHVVQVQAFRRASLLRMRRVAPLLPLAQLYPMRMPARLIEADLLRASATVSAIAPQSASVDAELIAAAHDHGLRVQPWTVNDPAQIERLMLLGVDGVITDAPDLARSATMTLNMSAAAA